MTTAGPPERDALLVRLEALERAHEKPHPLWKNTALVGLIGTLVAVIPPSLTAIREYYQTEREVRLSLAKYQHERTLSYLDRALSPETEEAKQAQVFRFLRHLPEDDPVHKWATEELTIVQESIEGLKHEIAANEAKLRQLEREKKATVQQATAVIEAAAPKDEIETVVQAAQLEVASYDRTIERIQEETNNLKSRAGEAPTPRGETSLTVADNAADAGAMAAAPRPSQWRLRIATSTNLEDALVQVNKARNAGAEDPVVYRKGSFYFVVIGRYGSAKEAADRVTEARRFVDGSTSSIRPIDVMVWCSSQKTHQGFIECTH